MSMIYISDENLRYQLLIITSVNMIIISPSSNWPKVTCKSSESHLKWRMMEMVLLEKEMAYAMSLACFRVSQHEAEGIWDKLVRSFLGMLGEGTTMVCSWYYKASG